MNSATYERLKNNKPSFYATVNISDLKFESDYLTIEGSSFKDIELTDGIRDSICKYVGFSSAINKGLYSTDKDLWYKVLTKLYKYYSKETIILLMSESFDGYSIKGLCNSSRELISNEDFLDKAISYYDIYKDILVEDIGYSKDSSKSYIVLSKDKDYKDPLNNDVTFKIGVVIHNDEMVNVTSRMAIIFSTGAIYYLPSKFYNLTSSRYDRSTSSSMESLEMLLLRIMEDFTSEYLDNKIDDITSSIVGSNNKRISRSEYERIHSVISNSCALSDISSEETEDIFTELDVINDFENLYGEIQSDYIWKCTAIGGANLNQVLKLVGGISTQHVFYLEELTSVRDLLGEYLTTPRVCQMIAHAR